MLKPYIWCIRIYLRRGYGAFDFMHNLAQLNNLPPLRNLPKLTLLEAYLLMPWETEVDEPLLVQPPGHLLKDLDAARVVLDEVIVGGEDGGYLSLLIKRRKGN